MRRVALRLPGLRFATLSGFVGRVRRSRHPALNAGLEVVTHDQVTTPTGRVNVEVAFTEVQLSIVVPLATVMPVTRYDRVMPVVVVQGQNMAGGDGVVGTRFVAVQIGEVTADREVSLYWNGALVASLAASVVTSSVPVYRWP